jgi:hypothetical protein
VCVIKKSRYTPSSILPSGRKLDFAILKNALNLLPISTEKVKTLNLYNSTFLDESLKNILIFNLTGEEDLRKKCEENIEILKASSAQIKNIEFWLRDKNELEQFPNHIKIAKAFNLNYISVDSKNVWDSNMIDAFANSSPTLFIINVDPEQPYLPKVTSRILEDGSMVSNPIHKMFPPLSKELEIELGLN